jgi:hypothetical protein
MLVIYFRKLTTLTPPKIDFEDLSDMLVKITQKMNQFIYLSNNGGKNFINLFFAQNCKKDKRKAILARMAFDYLSTSERLGCSFFRGLFYFYALFCRCL